MGSAAVKLIKNTLSNTVFYFIGIALSFITIPVLISTVGDEGYGLIVLVGAVTGYFDILGLGVPGGNAKYVAEFHAREDEDGLYEVVDTSLGFFFTVGLVMSCVIVLLIQVDGLGWFVSGENLSAANSLFYVAAAVALIAWPTRALGSTLTGLQEYHIANIARTTCRVGGQIAMIVTALAGASLVYIFLAREAFTLVRAVWLFFIARDRLEGRMPNPFKFSKKAFKLIFGLSSLIVLSKVAGLLTYQTDKIIIGAALPVGMLSVYSILSKPAEVVRMVSSLFNSAVMPAVSAEQEKRGKEGVDQFIYEGSRYNNALVAPFAVISTYLAGPFLTVWVGPKYLEWIWIAQLSCIFMLVWQSNSLLGRVYFGSGKALKPALIAFLTAAFNAVLSVVLVQVMGVAGVLFATLVAGAIAVPLAYWFIFPDFDIDRRGFFKSVVLKAQWPSIVLGILCIPAWPVVQSIDSWAEFTTAGIAFSAVFFPASFFNAVPSERRKLLYRWFKTRVAR